MTLYEPGREAHFRNSHKTGLSALYVNITLRRFALSLIGIFMPVYLFTRVQTGDEIDVAIGLYSVAFYFLIWIAVKLAFLIPAASLIRKLGYRWTITLSNVCWMLLLYLLYLSDTRIEFLVICPFVHAIATCFYWLSYHSLFAQDGHTSHLGREVGLSQLITYGVSIVGPLLGGLIIDSSGFSKLFTLALFIMGVSGLPFFFLPHHKSQEAVTFSSLYDWMKDPKHKNEIVSIFGRSIEEKVALTFYPVFVYLVVGAYTKQGFIASASLVVGTAAVYIAGKLMDKSRNRKRFLFGVIGTALTWPLKAVVKTFSSLLALDVISSSISPFYWVNFESLVYKDVRRHEENALLFMTARLAITGLAYLTVLIVVLATAFTRYNFLILFVLASFGALLSYYIWESKNEKH